MTTTLRPSAGRVLPSVGLLVSLCLTTAVLAQETRPDEETSETIVLSPFEVSAQRDDGGYTA